MFMNLVGIAKGLSINNKGKSLKEIYNSYFSDTHLKSLFQKMPAIDVIKIIFLIKAINDGKDPNKELQTINSFLFSFSIVYFDPDDVEVECSECDGNGRRTCYECDGDGNVNCSECDGTGKNTYDESGNEDCDYCDGDGAVTCDYCNGDGEYDCDYCDGIGTQTLDNAKKYTIQQYVSYNTSVFDYVNKFNESLQEIDENYLIDSPNTFTIITELFEPETISDDDDFLIKDRFIDNTYVNNVVDTPDLDLIHMGSGIQEADSYLRKRFKKKS